MIFPFQNAYILKTKITCPKDKYCRPEEGTMKGEVTKGCAGFPTSWMSGQVFGNASRATVCP
ncbi:MULTISPECIES: hypothetical protein [Acidianus]|uniref:Uncharacterized protein n=1 Tax=Candidatus Acidianus copahuensis TaxID=1160895 RepID=A0A031LNF7_9CREN|nr:MULTISPECIES: hypothetical protein [Acidianus]EZQ04950.1 hypothetical protein CM19_08010 [Candidatus Acidianus copahuensis]